MPFAIFQICFVIYEHPSLILSKLQCQYFIIC